MLNSWFATKPDGEAQVNAPGRRSTEASHLAATFETELTDVESTPDEAPHSTFLGPHDVALTELYGETGAEESSAYRKLSNSTEHVQVIQGDSPQASPTPGSTVPSFATQPIAPRPGLEILHDPYDGSYIGPLVSLEPSFGHDGTGVDGFGKNEDLWSHLSKVLDLQNQVARMHVDMEGIGSKSGDGKGKASKSGASRRPEWKHRPGRHDTGQTGSTVEEEEQYGYEEGVDMAGDEEAEKTRLREGEFAKLADQFEGRKDSINEIMNKLDGLSKALTEFHALQVPKIEFPQTSRHDSVGPSLGPSPRDTPLVYIRPPLVTASTLPGNTSLGFDKTLRQSVPGKPTGFVINVDEPHRQIHAFDSPVSTNASLLPPEV